MVVALPLLSLNPLKRIAMQEMPQALSPNTQVKKYCLLSSVLHHLKQPYIINNDFPNNDTVAKTLSNLDQNPSIL